MSRLFIVPPSCVLSNNTNHKNTSIQMVHYQSIPAATHHANAEQDDTVKTNKSIMVRRIVAGAVLLILCVGLGVVATTQTFRSRRSIILAGPAPLVSSPPAATATTTLLRATTTTVAGAGGGDHDHCCAPATGTWSGVSFSEDDDDGTGDPYETCYYSCDLAALKDADTAARVSSCYCWSKSYYAGLWRDCAPAGGNWQAYDEETFDSRGDDKNNVPQKVTYCGTPCQEFEKQNIDGPVPTCPP